MIDIAKKKLPAPVLPILLYFSYCAMYWFSMRGNLVYYSYELLIVQDFFTNDAWAFFLGGLIPFAIYMIVSSVMFKRINYRAGGNAASLHYGLNIALIAANLVLFGLKFMYLAIPLYAPLLNIILDPVVTILFVALYMLYAYKMNYVEKYRFAGVLKSVLGTFLTVYGLLATIGLITALA